MEISLSKEGIEEISKLTYTSMLSNDKLMHKFGLKIKELTGLKKAFLVEKVTLRDLILGALFTKPNSSIAEISNYIDNKDHYHYENIKLEKALSQLYHDGFVYVLDDIWNYNERQLEFYDNSTESFVGEVTLVNFDLPKMKAYFKPSTKDPLMYDVFDINEANYQILDGKANWKFDFEKYSYYLTCRQGENAI